MASSSIRDFCCCNHLCDDEDDFDDEAAFLYAFDFDHTIVDQNSDAAVWGILSEPIPDELIHFYDGTNWQEYMDKIFRYIWGKGGTCEVLAEQLITLKSTIGMERLLQRIITCRNFRQGSRLIIVSDANAFFIKTFLDSRIPPVIPDAIIANHAEQTEEGCLKISPYKSQSSCPLCPKNLCKGDALLHYIHTNGPFNKVFYTGDGGNDICPAMKLRENDVLFVRKYFMLEKIISKGTWKGKKISIKAKVVFWEDAAEIEKQVYF